MSLNLHSSPIPQLQRNLDVRRQRLARLLRERAVAMARGGDVEELTRRIDDDRRAIGRLEVALTARGSADFVPVQAPAPAPPAAGRAADAAPAAPAATMGGPADAPYACEGNLSRGRSVVLVVVVVVSVVSVVSGSPSSRRYYGYAPEMRPLREERRSLRRPARRQVVRPLSHEEARVFELARTVAGDPALTQLLKSGESPEEIALKVLARRKRSPSPPPVASSSRSAKRARVRSSTVVPSDTSDGDDEDMATEPPTQPPTPVAQPQELVSSEGESPEREPIEGPAVDIEMRGEEEFAAFVARRRRSNAGRNGSPLLALGPDEQKNAPATQKPLSKPRIRTISQTSAAHAESAPDKAAPPLVELKEEPVEDLGLVDRSATRDADVSKHASFQSAIVISSDELSDEEEEEQRGTKRAPPPVKRGRGRPPKRTKVVMSEDEEDELENDTENDGSSDLDINVPTGVGTVRFTVSSHITYDDLLDEIHCTIGCINVRIKPILTAKTGDTTKRGDAFALASDSNWQTIVRDAVTKYEVLTAGSSKKAKAARTQNPTISICLEENYLNSLKHTLQKQTAKGNGNGVKKKKNIPIDLDAGDDELEIPNNYNISKTTEATMNDVMDEYQHCKTGRCNGPCVKIDDRHCNAISAGMISTEHSWRNGQEST
ncbi:hypothetical protein EXIGLDRAFT_707253 [Exidia glandulosa HHB12029]|uniref:Uncharacterized protein n=2 Tax=Exidia glandulosa HHB12029 TaxID=1314781 RepID=A0A166NM88_EXIGL|nr:hypothetical protein EXIGLDRAFT_707253 [Exidia glandulosa HHB12029]